MVGTNQGVVNRQHQGTGLATVLEGSRALDTADRLFAEGRAVKRQDDLLKKQALDAGYDRMIKFNPEHWYKHDNQIQQNLDQWWEGGTKLMNQGIDPWKSTDPESTKFRTDYLKISGLAAGSKQLQERFNKLREKIDGAEPDKYTAKSLTDLADFFESDLNDIVANGKTAPDLEQRTPFIQLNDFYSKTMQPLNQKRNGNPYTQDELWDIAKKSLQDPEKGDDLADSFRSAYNQMDAQEQDKINRKAKAAGVSVPQQMAFDYSALYAQEQKPFEYDGWKKAAVDRVKVPYKSWQGSDSFSKKVDKAELAKITDTVAKDMFIADPRALQEYEKVLPRTLKETDGKYMQRAQKHLAETMRNEVATSEEAGLTAAGAGKKDLQDSRNQWLSDMISPSPDRYSEASGYLLQTGDMLGNMTVTETAVIPPESNTTVMTKYPTLQLKLKGNLTLKDIESETGIGLPADTHVEQRGTETEVQIPINTRSENALLTLHDKAFGQKKNAPYKGTYSATPVPKMSQILGGGNQAAPVTPKQKFSF